MSVSAPTTPDAPCIEKQKNTLRTLSNIVALCALTTLAISQMGCGDDAQSASPDEETEDTSAIPVEAGTARIGVITALFTGTAILEAEEEADVVAKATGVVQRLRVEEGDYVKAGQILAELDSERSSLELVQLEANLKRIENDFKRNEELYKKKLISAATYELVMFQFESEKVSIDLARLQISYASIRTPISGFVSERMVKVGSMVAVNQAVFRVTNFDPLLAVLYVPERELSRLKKGQQATVWVDPVTDTHFEARIERIAPVIDPSTGTFKVTLEVMDESGLLRPGMLARVSVTYDVHDEVIVIPKEALILEDDASAVFVVRDSVAYKQRVETGYNNESLIEITAGLSVDDIVVTTGQNTLKDSARVSVIE